jgi:hypothetical protein
LLSNIVIAALGIVNNNLNYISDDSVVRAAGVCGRDAEREEMSEKNLDNDRLIFYYSYSLPSHVIHV